MARTLLVRPREHLRFVWGRTKPIISWLNLPFTGTCPARSMALAGRTAALAAMISTLMSFEQSAALADPTKAPQAAALATAGTPFDMTAGFAALAILFLLVSNFVLWRERRADAATFKMMEPELSIPARRSDATEIASATWNEELQFGKLDRSLTGEITEISEADLTCQEKAQELARISHELRTPLNAVIGFSDLMRREMFGPLGHDKYLEYVEHIEASGHSLLSAVDDIFELTQEREAVPYTQERNGLVPGDDVHNAAPLNISDQRTSE